MVSINGKKIRKLNIATHRDLGYFFCALILTYSISGIALNHVDDWNPDFIIQRKNITIPTQYSVKDISYQDVIELSAMVGESKFKVYDFPTKSQMKVYYQDASMHVNFENHTGVYEQLTRRYVFYESNVIHRNSLKGWKWASDIFAVFLIIINLTGLFILKGKNGITGRGKWLILAGLLPPVLAIVLFEYFQS